LRQIAERRGLGGCRARISGSRGRDGRPGLDLMLNDARRRKFDVANVIGWSTIKPRSLEPLSCAPLEACCLQLREF
jgi:hypothetical protein